MSCTDVKIGSLFKTLIPCCLDCVNLRTKCFIFICYHSFCFSEWMKRSYKGDGDEGQAPKNAAELLNSKGLISKTNKQTYTGSSELFLLELND